VSLSAIPRSLRDRVFGRDEGKCRYCRLAQVGQGSVFHINHVLPRSQGGPTTESNLVLQCPHCSLHKSDKVVFPDPIGQEIVQLFHPLRQNWGDHFELLPTGECRGLTPVGRGTVAALQMNNSLPRIARAIQIRIGLLALRTQE
jgi:hypothetical protein